MNNNEAFSRVIIDALLADQGWRTTDARSVRYEVTLADGRRADYVLCDRHGRSLAVIEAKRFAIEPQSAQAQARDYACQLDVPYVFLSNGRQTLFWEWQSEAYPRAVKTFFKQDDLERRFATLKLRRDILSVPIDTRIAGAPETDTYSIRRYQSECIHTLCRELVAGRRKLLVEMATGAGKTRVAAAFIKRLFAANAITRVLFLVDRIQLGRQAEDAFADHLPDYPAYVLRSGRRFQDEKRITITTLQGMVNIYQEYSPGYFDLIISDECHRSIYGKWSGVLKYFDGIQLGLTATPCIADGARLGGDVEDQLFVRDTLRFFELSAPTYAYRFHEAIRDGVLVPYQIYTAQTVKTAAEGGFEVRRAEIDWSALDAATGAELELLFADEDPLIVDPAALERRFTIPERNRAIVREFRNVLENGYADKKGQKHWPLLGKTIVFAVNKKHAATLAQLFDDEFADKKPAAHVRYADYVVSAQGRDDTLEAQDLIARFKNEKFPQILVSVNMLDTGFDCPEVCNLVFARFTRSLILFQQMRGRGARRAPNKSLFTLFDFVGVCAYHGDADTPGEGGLLLAQKQQPRAQPRRLLALDVDDHIDPTTRAWISVDENGKLLSPAAVEEAANILGLRFEAWRLTLTAQDAEQERWLRILGSQIRANADTLKAVTPEHFTYFHPFVLLGGMQEALRVFGGENKLQALLAALNAAVFAAAPDNPSAEVAHAARPFAQ